MIQAFPVPASPPGEANGAPRKTFPSDLAIADLGLILRANERLTRARIQQAVSRLCVEAHALGMRCEEVIIQLKQTWARIPEAGSYRAWSETGVDGGDLLSCVVSEFIGEFYRTRPADAAASN